LTPENFLNDYVSIAWHLDEPVADPNVISYWHMAQAASEYSTELFSGMGCDELFAGHSRYSTEEQQSALLLSAQNVLRDVATKYVVPVVNKINHSWAYSILKRSRKNVWQSEYVEANALTTKDEMERICPNLCELFDPEVFLSKFYNLSHIKSPTSSYIYFDVKTSLPDRFMLEVERVSSAFALQWHTPFLTKNIVEFAASLPIESRLSEEETASPLKILLKPIFPDAVTARPKRSRHNFLVNWIENSELHLLFEALPKGTLVEVGIVDEGWITEAVKTAESRKENFRVLWSILSLEVWFKLYINHPITPDPPYVSVRDLLQED
jgi:asparagine synthase (glutamine-hydrolysing)